MWEEGGGGGGMRNTSDEGNVNARCGRIEGIRKERERRMKEGR